MDQGSHPATSLLQWLTEPERVAGEIVREKDV